MQILGLVVLGGPSHRWHSPDLSLLRTRGRSSGPSHSPQVVLSRGLERYYGRLRLPPGSDPFPEVFGYGAGRSGAFPQAPGRGGPPQFPPSPSERSTPPTPGSSSGLRSRLFAPSVAFTLKDGARLSLVPREAGTLTARQASLDAADRSVAPPKGAFDAGLRPDPFPGRAASLLPGSLATTRAGLAPAGDDGLTAEPVASPPRGPACWAHTPPRCK